MIQIKSTQDIEKMEEIPLEDRNLPQNTYEMLQRGASLNPQKTALQFFLQGTKYKKSNDFTFHDFIQHIHQTSNMLYDLGIQQDDVVSLLLPNLPETYFSIWGGEATGIVNPINPLLEPKQIADIMNAAGTKVLITLAPFPKTDLWQKVEKIKDSIPSLQVILTIDLGIYLTGVKKWVVKLMNKKPQSNGKQKILDFHQTAGQYPKDRLNFQRIIKPNDIASYFHTGGTTGTPKLAAHTHANEVFNAWSAGKNMELDVDNTFFCGLPLFHVNGVIVTGLLPWSAGASVVLGTPQGYRGEGIFDNFWKIVEHYKINLFSGVPTVYQVLLNTPLQREDISSLNFAICGAAPMPVETFKEFQKKTNVKILEGYGLTEGTCISTVNPPYGERKVGSIGFRIPYQEMKAVILDQQQTYVRDSQTDEIGTVVIRGANIFPGYKSEEHNAKVFIDTGDGKGKWFNTGDLGRQDSLGYFWLTGRQKELIIRGGHNIDPKIIEEPLHEHPAVALVAAVGHPDPRVGEVPVAYIQLKEGNNTNEKELMQFARENITERAAHPKFIRLIDEMPVTAVGKIFKPKLVWQEIENVYKTEVESIDAIATCSIQVKSDKIKGTLAFIEFTMKEGFAIIRAKEHIRQKLGAYAIAFELQAKK